MVKKLENDLEINFMSKEFHIFLVISLIFKLCFALHTPIILNTTVHI